MQGEAAENEEKYVPNGSQLSTTIEKIEHLYALTSVDC